MMTYVTPVKSAQPMASHTPSGEMAFDAGIDTCKKIQSKVLELVTDLTNPFVLT